MKKEYFTRPIDLKEITVTDPFWKAKQELVRTEVIPYQFKALNDLLPDAEPSYCMHNFRTAGDMVANGRTDRKYVFKGFQVLPEEEGKLEEDSFYGFVFQDTDFSKWIEAAAYSLAQHPNPELEQTADAAIDVVCAAQLPNGYLDTYYIISGMDMAFTNLKDHHELYCLGHLLEGAIAYYQATGKDKLLQAACRFADYVDDYFADGKCMGYPGHEIAEMALTRLYEATGEERYLKLAERFLLRRGTEPHYFDQEQEKSAGREDREYKPDKDPNRYAYYQAHKSVLQQQEAVGHAVRAMYLYSGMADVARLTGNEAMYEACRRLWDSTVRTKLYITGGIGGTVFGEAFSHPYDLPNDAAYSETCAAIGLAFFARRMLQIRPDSRVADVMEQAVYNTVLAGMALDGKSFFYVNPLEVVPENCGRDQRLAHVKPIRQRWFGCACCPPNIARLVSSIPSYAYTMNDRKLYMHLFMGGVIETELQGRRVKLAVTSALPWEGQVAIKVLAMDSVTERQIMEDEPPMICVRVPGWTESGRISGCVRQADGIEMDMTERLLQRSTESGYIEFPLKAVGDEYILDFPMPVRMKKAHRLVRENTGRVAFTRGPITYCMEEADNGAELHLLAVDTDAFLQADPYRLAKKERIAGEEAMVIRVQGYAEKKPERTQAAEMELYEDYAAPEWTPCELTLLPYYIWNNRGEGEMKVWITAQ